MSDALDDRIRTLVAEVVSMARDPRPFCAESTGELPSGSRRRLPMWVVALTAAVLVLVVVGMPVLLLRAHDGLDRIGPAELGSPTTSDLRVGTTQVPASASSSVSSNPGVPPPSSSSPTSNPSEPTEQYLAVMPDVTSLHESAALDLVLQRGLLPETLYVGFDAPDGTVVWTDPPPGTTVDLDSHVVVSVARSDSAELREPAALRRAAVSLSTEITEASPSLFVGSYSEPPETVAVVLGPEVWELDSVDRILSLVFPYRVRFERCPVTRADLDEALLALGQGDWLTADDRYQGVHLFLVIDPSLCAVRVDAEEQEISEASMENARRQFGSTVLFSSQLVPHSATP